MIVLFIVLARNKLRIPLERVRTQERCDKISGLYPSCGLTTEPHLSKPLWAHMSLTSPLSPENSFVPAGPPVINIHVTPKSYVTCAAAVVGACRWQLGKHLRIILLFAALRAAAAAECGNGLQEEGEACEDGNNVRPRGYL